MTTPTVAGFLSACTSGQYVEQALRHTLLTVKGYTYEAVAILKLVDQSEGFNADTGVYGATEVAIDNAADSLDELDLAIGKRARS